MSFENLRRVAANRAAAPATYTETPWNHFASEIQELVSRSHPDITSNFIEKCAVPHLCGEKLDAFVRGEITRQELYESAKQSDTPTISPLDGSIVFASVTDKDKVSKTLGALVNSGGCPRLGSVMILAQNEATKRKLPCIPVCPFPFGKVKVGKRHAGSHMEVDVAAVGAGGSVVAEAEAEAKEEEEEEEDVSKLCTLTTKFSTWCFNSIAHPRQVGSTYELGGGKKASVHAIYRILCGFLNGALYDYYVSGDPCCLHIASLIVQSGKNYMTLYGKEALANIKDDEPITNVVAELEAKLATALQNKERDLEHALHYEKLLSDSHPGLLCRAFFLLSISSQDLVERSLLPSLEGYIFGLLFQGDFEGDSECQDGPCTSACVTTAASTMSSKVAYGGVGDVFLRMILERLARNVPCFNPTGFVSKQSLVVAIHEELGKNIIGGLRWWAFVASLLQVPLDQWNHTCIGKLAQDCKDMDGLYEPCLLIAPGSEHYLSDEGLAEFLVTASEMKGKRGQVLSFEPLVSRTKNVRIDGIVEENVKAMEAAKLRAEEHTKNLLEQVEKAKASAFASASASTSTSASSVVEDALMITDQDDEGKGGEEEEKYGPFVEIGKGMYRQMLESRKPGQRALEDICGLFGNVDEYTGYILRGMYEASKEHAPFVGRKRIAQFSRRVAYELHANPLVEEALVVAGIKPMNGDVGPLSRRKYYNRGLHSLIGSTRAATSLAASQRQASARIAERHKQLEEQERQRIENVHREAAAEEQQQQYHHPHAGRFSFRSIGDSIATSFTYRQELLDRLAVAKEQGVKICIICFTESFDPRIIRPLTHATPTSRPHAEDGVICAACFKELSKRPPAKCPLCRVLLDAKLF